MACSPAGSDFSFNLMATPVAAGLMTAEPTLLPVASFNWTTVAAALDSDKARIVSDNARKTTVLCLMDKYYSQLTGLSAIHRSIDTYHASLPARRSLP